MLKEIKSQVSEIMLNKKGKSTEVEMKSTDNPKRIVEDEPAVSVPKTYTGDDSVILSTVTAMSEDIRRLQIEMAIQRRQVRAQLQEVRKAHV